MRVPIASPICYGGPTIATTCPSLGCYRPAYIHCRLKTHSTTHAQVQHTVLKMLPTLTSSHHNVKSFMTRRRANYAAGISLASAISRILVSGPLEAHKHAAPSCDRPVHPLSRNSSAVDTLAKTIHIEAISPHCHQLDGHVAFARKPILTAQI